MLSYAWPDDPQPLARAAGATWSIEPVLAPGGGHLPAWRFDPLVSDDAARKTWVIGVHGRGARRAELFRIVHTALDCGNTALVISYRTDEWAAAPAPRLQLGQSEWEDLEHAVALALVRGAERIVLAGCSLGGSIVATFLRRSDLADRVVGVILDSPALDWGPILEHIASAARLPRWLVPPIMAAAKARSRLDFDALNHVKGADEFGHPILLFHGDADPIVPVWLSDAFAAARPDLVTYVRVDGAGHVHSWNHAPGRYRRALRDFFQQVNISHVPAAAPPSMVRRVARLLPDPPGRDNEAWR